MSPTEQPNPEVGRRNTPRGTTAALPDPVPSARIRVAGAKVTYGVLTSSRHMPPAGAARVLRWPLSTPFLSSSSRNLTRPAVAPRER
eukprot:scaffold2961_cov118-Isochrysis_galbana.AAC.1